MGLRTKFRKFINKYKNQNKYFNHYAYSYHSDKKYNVGIVQECFKDRFENSDDIEIIKRITKAYNLAMSEYEKAKPCYKVSNEWLPIYESQLGEMISLLKNNEYEKLQEKYKNFWRNECAAGLIGLGVEISDFEQDKATNENKITFLEDTFNRLYLWKDLVGYACDYSALESPTIGNSYGIEIDGKFLKSGADYLHYYAFAINRMLNKEEKSVVVELGAGYGGMPYYLLRDNSNLSYIDVDLPENTALASYYLLKCFPDKKIALYGEIEINEKTIKEYDIIMLPSFAIEQIPNNIADLFFNSYSLAEMDEETIINYLNQMDRITTKYFYHVNHTKKCKWSADKFPVSPAFKLLSRQKALWNLGRNIQMDEFEFLYSKI